MMPIPDPFPISSFVMRTDDSIANAESLAQFFILFDNPRVCAMYGVRRQAG
jgi:hypothetical protein